MASSDEKTLWRVVFAIALQKCVAWPRILESFVIVSLPDVKDVGKVTVYLHQHHQRECSNFFYRQPEANSGGLPRTTVSYWWGILFSKEQKCPEKNVKQHFITPFHTKKKPIKLQKIFEFYAQRVERNRVAVALLCPQFITQFWVIIKPYSGRLLIISCIGGWELLWAIGVRCMFLTNQGVICTTLKLQCSISVPSFFFVFVMRNKDTQLLDANNTNIHFTQLFNN